MTTTVVDQLNKNEDKRIKFFHKKADCFGRYYLKKFYTYKKLKMETIEISKQRY